MIDLKEFTAYNKCEPPGAALPVVEIDNKYYKQIGVDPGVSNIDFLRNLVKKCIIDRGFNKKDDKNKYYDQCKRELELFDKIGMVDYVLALWDIINFCKENNIPLGDGRGSASSSVIFYLIGITNVDPFEFGLFLERFVSEDRVCKVATEDGVDYFDGGMLMDCDIDIDYDRRGEVISYIENKYKGKTAKILTFTTLSSKICLRELSKYFLGINEDDATLLTNLIPKKYGIAASFKDSKEQSDEFNDFLSENTHISECCEKLEDLVKNYGVHPCGIVISRNKLDEVIPLQKTKDGDIITGYEMNDVADLCVKFDLLGLRTLTLVRNICSRLNIEIDSIDYKDKSIYQFLQDYRHPAGLFQISADTNFDVCRRVKPSNIYELSDVIALARPGALAFVQDYVDQKENSRPLGLHDKLDKILGSTKNLLLYQEQVLKVLKEVFGMSAGEAEKARKIIGKKMTKEIPALKEKFYKCAETQNINKETSDYVWDIIEASANYQFALAHSAAYAILAAKTVYLKANHPLEFYLELLRLAKFEPEPIQVISNIEKEFSDYNMKLLNPSLEFSEMDFSVEGDNIRYGLSSIKGIKEKTLKSVVEFRGKSFSNRFEIFDTAKQAGMSVDILAALIQAGALSCGQYSRNRAVLEAYVYNKLTDREKREFFLLGEQYSYDILRAIGDVVENNRCGSNGKPLMKESRLGNFLKSVAKYKRLYDENSRYKKLAIWWFESELLGYSPSFNLIDCFDENGLIQLKDVNDLQSNSRFKIACRFVSKRIRVSKNDNKYLLLELTDDSASGRFMLFEKSGDFEKLKKVKKGDLLIVSGTTNGSAKFLDFVSVLDNKIFVKVCQLK